MKFVLEHYFINVVRLTTMQRKLYDYKNNITIISKL